MRWIPSRRWRRLKLIRRLIGIPLRRMQDNSCACGIGWRAPTDLLLHHDSITTTQCSTIRSMRSDFELMALIDHGRGHFSCDVETAASQFLRQAGLVGTFQQTRAEARRNLARGIDDRTCDFIYWTRVRTCRRGRLMHTRFTHDRGALGKTGEQTILLDFAPELGAGVFGIQFG
jgi:hypothetical protein